MNMHEANFGEHKPAWGCSAWDALFLYAIARQVMTTEDSANWASWACRPVRNAEIAPADLTDAASALLGRRFEDTPEQCRQIQGRLEELYEERHMTFPFIPNALFDQVRRTVTV